MKVVIIRDIGEDEQKAIEIAKRESGFKQASKAIMTIVIAYYRMINYHEKLKEENRKLKEENKRLREAGRLMREGSKLLNDIL